MFSPTSRTSLSLDHSALLTDYVLISPSAPLASIYCWPSFDDIWSHSILAVPGFSHFSNLRLSIRSVSCSSRSNLAQHPQQSHHHSPRCRRSNHAGNCVSLDAPHISRWRSLEDLVQSFPDLVISWLGSHYHSKHAVCLGYCRETYSRIPWQVADNEEEYLSTSLPSFDCHCSLLHHLLLHCFLLSALWESLHIFRDGSMSDANQLVADVWNNGSHDLPDSRDRFIQFSLTDASRLAKASCTSGDALAKAPKDDSSTIINLIAVSLLSIACDGDEYYSTHGCSLWKHRWRTRSYDLSDLFPHTACTVRGWFITTEDPNENEENLSGTLTNRSCVVFVCLSRHQSYGLAIWSFNHSTSNECHRRRIFCSAWLFLWRCIEK